MTHIKNDNVYLPWSNIENIAIPDTDQIAIFANKSGALCQMDENGDVLLLDNSGFYPLANAEVTGSDVAQIQLDLGAIDQDFDTIQVALLLRSDESDWEDTLNMTFNEIASGAAAMQYTIRHRLIFHETDTWASAYSSNIPFTDFAYVVADNATSGYFSPLFFTFYNLYNTQFRAGFVMRLALASINAGVVYLTMASGIWAWPDRVNTIEFYPDVGSNFKVGSKLWAWGIQ